MRGGRGGGGVVGNKGGKKVEEEVAKEMREEVMGRSWRSRRAGEDEGVVGGGEEECEGRCGERRAAE